ncbi:MAG: hypothetical protein R3330_07605, partial [Saprospiraceae bacterium]|nr:hypothetical protein [Saprospiraceae bacterium]
MCYTNHYPGLLFIALVFCCWTVGQSQGLPITMDEAVHIASSHHAGLRSMRLSVDQRDRLAEAGPKQPPGELYLSGEEFDFGGQTGIHSLNLAQNFLLPGASRAYRQFHLSQATLAREELNLGQHALRMEVGKAFYRVLYTRQLSVLAHENLALY